MKKKKSKVRSEDDDLLRPVETPAIVRKSFLSIVIFDFWLSFVQKALTKYHFEVNSWRAFPVQAETVELRNFRDAFRNERKSQRRRVTQKRL